MSLAPKTRRPLLSPLRPQWPATDAAYILDTFPIVRRHDKAAFGNYRTKDMVLAYYNALAAGDTDTDVAV